MSISPSVQRGPASGDPGRRVCEDLDRALSSRDLSDPAMGQHAVQLIVAALERALQTAWSVPARHHEGARVVDVADNYDRLGYSRDAVTRDRRYTRYVDDRRMLRSHTTAHIPALLRDVANNGPDDLLLSIPGQCYRRDVIDRHHVGELHQIDLWRVRRSGDWLTEADLTDMVGLVVKAVLPGHRWRTPASEHPYTIAGREIYVQVGDRELEIGECGLAHPDVLAAAGLPATATGLAMGLGLDRLTMVSKGIDDIRLLRSADPRIAAQMMDLQPYQPVSSMPAARRDLSIAVDSDLDAELLGDQVRTILGADADSVEEVLVLSQTSYGDLPQQARQRLGLGRGQKNILLRIILRALDHTLSADDANLLRDRIYAGLHKGTARQWARHTH